MATVVDASASLKDKYRIEGILQALHEQRTISRFCDVTLRVCGEEIFAHSNVLAAASPYFGSFLGHGQDLPRAFSQKTPQVIEIHIDGSDGDSGYGEAVRKVVDYMYTSHISLNMGILTQVMEISKIIQMEPLTSFCEEFQNGFRGDKIVPSADAILKKVCTRVDIGTSTDDLQNAELTSESAEHAKVPKKPNQIKIGTSNPSKKRGRGRPRKTPVESDDDFSEFVSLMAEEEEKKKQEEINGKTKKEDEEEHLDDEEVNDDATNGEDMRRTRGRPTITSYLTARSRSGRRLLRGHIYKSDYVIHPLKRAKKNTPKVETEKPPEEKEEESDDKKEDKKGTILIPGRGRLYACEQCDFKSKRVKELTEHKKTHLHADNICSFCDYKAENEEDFKTHLLKHEGPTPYFCKFCNVKFKSRTQLNTHLPKHRDDKPFVCNLCRAGFKWKHALKNHMITHSVTKDHLCDICGFATAHKSQLKAHRLIHTGETFKCDYEGCTFEATKRQNLKYHSLTHTHEKPHQCEICGHSFSLIKNMKRHMLLHSDDRPYSCQDCAFSTTRYDKLKEHMLKQHSVGEPPSKKHRISDYHEEETTVIGSDIMSQATLQTVANIVCADENAGETQIFQTVDGVPIVARVQYAEINSQGVVQYVAQVE